MVDFLKSGSVVFVVAQESYYEVANRLNLHVVEFTMDHNGVPNVLASPRAGVATEVINCTGLKTDPLAGTARASPNAPKVGNRKPSVDLPSLYDFWKAEEAHAGQRPVLEITNPLYRKAKPKPDTEYDPVDDLVVGMETEEEEEVARLLERGERDLDTIVTVKGLVPNIRGNPPPPYLSSPGVLKRKAERYRYRNQEASRRERMVYSALDER